VILKRREMLVSVGSVCGAVPPFAPLKLSKRNLKIVHPKYVLSSVSCTRLSTDRLCSVIDYCVDPEKTALYGSQLFAMVADGTLPVQVHQ
jgi:NADPH2:quinone reductase